ncbi:ComEC/Rec2 family competence protein [Bacillus sp. T3]|uniref:ComEC/Rec2 family competence protein n=1 Tax=Bacillus sp. T3 TaxID=467262 RepID=UPI00298143D0|nr:ComEC/Rec2 family competence protein [Bacillus sp. T3]
MKAYFPEPIRSLAIALLFGERAVMDSDLVQAYERIGIVHLLAISRSSGQLFDWGIVLCWN